jgi:acyl carrier protein
MLEKITEILRNYKGEDDLQVTEATTFEELGLDSLDTVQLVMEIEEEFGVSIEMDKSITNVAAVMAIIENSK